MLCLGRNFMTLCSIAIQPSLQSFGRDQPETHSLAIAVLHVCTVHTYNSNEWHRLLNLRSLIRSSKPEFLHTNCVCVDFTPKFKPTLVHTYTVHTNTLFIN